MASPKIIIIGHFQPSSPKPAISSPKNEKIEKSNQISKIQLQKKKDPCAKNEKKLPTIPKYQTLKDYTQSSIPVSDISDLFAGISPSFPIKKMCATYGHILILFENGDLWGFGSNSSHQLGIESVSETETQNFVSKPQKILEKVVDVSTGLAHSVAIMEDGGVMSWGSGRSGQLGHASLEDEAKPRRIAFFDKMPQFKAVSVACGDAHTLILTKPGQVFGFGVAEFGQLGILHHLHDIENEDNVEKHEDEVEYDPKVLCPQWTPKLLDLRTTIIQPNGQKLRKFVKFVKIGCGQNYSILLTEDGEIYICGEGLSGVLGQGKLEKHSLKPVKVKFEPETPENENEPQKTTNLPYRKAIININFQENETHDDIIPKLSFDLKIEKKQSLDRKIIDFACGSNHFIVLTSNHEVFSCGLNFCGQLGLGSKEKSLLLKKMDISHYVLNEIGVGAIFCGGLYSGFVTRSLTEKPHAHVFISGQVSYLDGDVDLQPRALDLEKVLSINDEELKEKKITVFGGNNKLIVMVL